MSSLEDDSDIASGTKNLHNLDSCPDSGFCRSGSNIDSSLDECVSDNSYRMLTLEKQGTEGKGECTIPSWYPEEAAASLQITNQAIEQASSPKECEKNESDQGGSEGGSEGSSPVPSEEQLAIILEHNKPIDSNLLEFLSEEREVETEGKITMSPLDPILITKQEESFPLREAASPMEEEEVEQPAEQPVKWRPNVEELAFSGDSSEKKPPPQLPKLHKNKPLVGQKRSRHTMSQKMLSDTQENNENSNSTGSECDEGPHAKRPHHQKPHKMLSKPRPVKMLQKALQERNIKRTKLMKRKESNSIKAKALLHHHPTQEDISNLLKEFTVDFMINGYSNLLQGLRLQVMMPYQIDLDKSHLLWLITYFLRFAVELDLELSQICPVLCVDVSTSSCFSVRGRVKG